MMDRQKVSKWTQLKAMVVRNTLLKKRSGRKTLAECLVPLWFLAILVLIKSLLPDPLYNPVIIESADTPIALDLSLKQLSENTTVPMYIVPNTTETRNFANLMQTFWSDLSWPLSSVNGPFLPLEFVFIDSEKELEDIYAIKNLTIPVRLAIVFDSDPFQNMSYTIRNHPDLAPLPVPSKLYALGNACRNPNATSLYPEYNALNSCPINSYFYTNFLIIQHIVEGTFLKWKMPEVEIPRYLEQFTMQLFPKGTYVDETSLLVLRYLVPFYMVLTLSQFILYLLTVIVGEKEKKIKEGLRMMGLSDLVYWLSWFLVYTVFVVVLTLIATGVLYGLKVFQNSNVGLIYLLFILYDLSVLMLAFLMTAFFDKARVAGLFGALAVSFLNLFYYIQVATGDATPTWLYWFLALISPTGFALGMDKALLLEITTPTGVTVDTLWDGPGLPLAGSYIMLSVDIVLYILLAYYLDNVLPSEYGAKRSPWFFLSASFWCGATKNNSSGQINLGYSNYHDSTNNEDVEAIPESLYGKEVLRIRGLSKTFKPFGRPQITAVNGLNLDVYEGQITAILGHNGAGKTTLFNMLTGMTAPTKGSAHLYGYDLSDPNQLEEIRRMTGVCPQHDVLFDQLTPREHLAFYAEIRGVSKDTVEKEVEKTLKDIDLGSKGDTQAGRLSGGQKRKLSIGIALIGDPKIVFLDEPTAGVDPYSRRHLWTLLQQRKANKVILLTTHFMDEADLLSDRKAIVSKGKLRCLGSSLFLKNKFGLGYHLTFVLNDKFRDTNNIRSLVTSYVAGAKLSRHYGRELSYVLPRQHVSAFPPLFSKLEELVNQGEADTMGFSSYGVSMTTLEEVFLKLGEEAELAEYAEQNKVSSLAPIDGNGKISLSGEEVKSEINYQEKRDENHNSTWELLSNLDVPIRESHNGQTLRAMLKIRGINMARDPMAVFFQVFMPVAFAALGIWLGTLSTERTIEVKKSFTFDMYRETNSTPLLYSESISGTNMSQFWSNLAERNGLSLENYSGNFTEIADLYFQNQPHWAAVDIEDTFSYLATLNETWLNGTVPGVVSDRLAYNHTRLRFNDTLIHTPPLMINSISNNLLKMNNIAENIVLSVYPLPYISPPGGFDPGQFTSAMFIGMLFVLGPSALACEIVLDREIHAKNLLRVNGLTFGQYFGSFFIVLGSMMVTTCILILLLIFAFQLQALVTPVAISLLAILYILFCPAAILFATCCSYLFKTLESAQSVFPNVSSFIGLIPYIVVIICDMFQVGGSSDLATGLHIGFCFIDILYIPYGILYYVNRIYFICLLTPHPGVEAADFCYNLTFSDYMTPEIVAIIVALFVHIPLYFVLLVIIDIKFSGGSIRDAFIFSKKSKSDASKFQGNAIVQEEYSGAGDSDVKAEHLRIQKILYEPETYEGEKPVVLIHGLHKRYGSADKGSGKCGKSGSDSSVVKPPAVNYMSFAVQSGEVFGLLGHNGAGKTTTMKIITAEEAPTHGRVQVDGHDITSNQSSAFQALGYCPQHDALWRNITVREHMEAYAAIRGIVPSHIPRIVDLFLKGLQIEQHANKYAKNCSGGTRRKLSYALSMLGRPAIVLMDEPSTGMDPQSKRFLWNTISASFQDKRGAILTTHSMEEADALCSRLGIMVKGEMRCLGTGQHLKNRYGSGYLLELKLKSLSSETSGSASLEDVEVSRTQRKANIIAHITSLFPSAQVQESFEDRVILAIAQDNITSLADTFKALEEAREKMSIEEYSFSQTTLEQVFIKFAHEQEDASAY